MRERNWSGTWTDWAYFRAYRLKKKNRRVTGMSQQLVCNDGAGGGGRTHMPSEGRGILSPVRLPVPPLQQVVGSFEVTTHRALRTEPAPVSVGADHLTQR